MPQKKTKKDEDAAKIAELTTDIQRIRADFENYRKRSEQEKEAAKEMGEARAIAKLLPAVDIIDRAVANIPKDIESHSWVSGISGLVKKLDTTLRDLSLSKIKSTEGTLFDPSLHQAIQFDEDSVGDKEVVAEELQTGYLHKGNVLRPAMVKAKRQ